MELTFYWEDAVSTINNKLYRLDGDLSVREGPWDYWDKL